MRYQALLHGSTGYAYARISLLPRSTESTSKHLTPGLSSCRCIR